MRIGLAFGLSGATVTSCLILTLSTGLVLGSAVSQQNDPLAASDGQSSNTSPGCPAPQLKHRASGTNGVVRSCAWKGGPDILNVGMVNYKPFTAEESTTQWKALPSNKSERRAMRKQLPGWKVSPDGTKMLMEPARLFVARDGVGRVLESTISNAVNTMGTICDPETERMISFNMESPPPPRLG